MDKIICGIQQVGIGVRNVAESWKWYKDNFGFDTKIFGAEGVAERMLPYTGGKPQPRYAILVYNLRGGAGFEVWEPRGRELNYVSFEPALGDLGIYACKIKSRDVQAAYRQLSKAQGARIVTEVTKTPDGREHFFLYDPWNNLFEVESDSYVFIDENKNTGGGNGAVLGVTDMDKSVKFYSTLMDYDKVEYDVTGVQADLNGVPGGQYPLRRVLLSGAAHSRRLRRTRPEKDIRRPLLGRPRLHPPVLRHPQHGGHPRDGRVLGTQFRMRRRPRLQDGRG